MEKDPNKKKWGLFIITVALFSLIAISIKSYWLLAFNIVFVEIFILKKTQAFFKNKWVKFAVALLIYIPWCIWIENYWFFLGLPIFYDIYISKKVNWAFWKKRVKEGEKRKKSKTVEWIDALVFAVIAATLIRTFFIEAFTIPTSSMEKSLLVGDYLFVSKVSYGPRLPNTPLSFPFVHHTMPFSESTPSFLEWIKMPYKRIAGFGKPERYDGMVFNFPTGDTVVVGRSNQGYYDIIRVRAMELQQMDNARGINGKTWEWYLKEARKQIWNQYEIIVRPTDKTDNYIKRCVGLPGDTLEIQGGQLLINGEKQKQFKGRQYNYLVVTNGTTINPKMLSKLGISDEDISRNREFYLDNLIQQDSSLLQYSNFDLYKYPLTDENVEKVKGFANVKKVIKMIEPKGVRNFRIFPHSENFPWNEDWFGPMLVPKKGLTVKVNTFNLPLYERIIGYYEKNQLEVKGDEIFINGEKAEEYTFKMDYYWLMGDNRHGSADSRFWGFVPEDHVVGKAVFIWLSLDKDKGWFDGKIRWNRMFKLVSSID